MYTSSKRALICSYSLSLREREREREWKNFKSRSDSENQRGVTLETALLFEDGNKITLVI